MKPDNSSRIAILAASLFCAVAAQAQDPFTNGLVAFYPLNDTALDATGHGNDGTVNGVTPTAGHGGISNSAYAFPGVAGKNITINSTNLMLQPPYSYSLWVNFSGGTQNPRFLCLGAINSGPVLALAGTSASRKIDFGLTTDAGAFGVESSNSFPQGIWHQIICVHATNAVSMYVDGAFQGSSPLSGSVETYPPNFGSFWLPTIGGQAQIGYPFDAFGGMIDSVRFYRRALSTQDISSLYAYETLCHPHPATATATVSYGFVVAATIIDGGCGYTNTPQVLILGGGGSGATAVATVSYGVVTGITMTSAGIGYTSTPDIFIGSAPVIGSQPQSLTVHAGDTAVFTVTDSDPTPANYQWTLGGAPISGATSSTFTISNVSPPDLGEYAVTLSNAFGSVPSASAELSMYPSLQTPFSGAMTYWGTNVSFTVDAWGSGPLTYQWYFNGVTLQDATNAVLDFSSIQVTNAGLYWIVVSNAYGSVTNAPAQVVVTPAGVSFGLSPRITISGVIGNHYLIRKTADLSDTNSWTLAGDLTLVDPTEIWVDTNIDSTRPENPHYYYEVLPAP